MFCPHKNSYLQLVCALNPRALNRSVLEARAALTAEELPEAASPLRRLTSAQPSLFAPCVDVTRARLGFQRIGLRKLNRDLHHADPFLQLQALHTLLDRVQRPESAFFLIHLHAVYRLVDLMLHDNAVVREKVCLILTHFSKQYRGRRAILSRPVIVENLLALIVSDPKKEVRYAAAFTLTTLTRDRCDAASALKSPRLVEQLLAMVKRDHVGIALLHLRTLEHAIEWDQEEPLRCGAFHVMRALFDHADPRVAVAGLDCAHQLLKHPEARRLADEHDFVFVLHDLLSHAYVEAVTAAAGAMQYATLTTRSKWRARERCSAITQKLLDLCGSSGKPTLQLFCLRTLVNLCDLPDVRGYMKANLLEQTRNLRFRSHEQWDGTSESTSYGLETGHNYRTLCIENTETIRNEFEDAAVVDVHSYLATLHEAKAQLIGAINWMPYP